MFCLKSANGVCKIYSFFSSYNDGLRGDIKRLIGVEDITLLGNNESFVGKLFEIVKDRCRFFKESNIIVHLCTDSTCIFPEEEFLRYYSPYSRSTIQFKMYSCQNDPLRVSLERKLQDKDIGSSMIKFQYTSISPLCCLGKSLFVENYGAFEIINIPLVTIITDLLNIFRSQAEKIKELVCVIAKENYLVSLGDFDTEDRPLRDVDLKRELFGNDFDRIMRCLGKFFKDNDKELFVEQIFGSTELNSKTTLFSEIPRIPLKINDFDVTTLPFRSGGAVGLEKGVYMINANSCDSYLIVYDFNGHRRNVFVDGGFATGGGLGGYEGIREAWNLIKHLKKIDAWILTHRDCDHSEVLGIFLKKYLLWEERGKSRNQRMPLLDTIVMRRTLYQANNIPDFDTTFQMISSTQDWVLRDADNITDKKYLSDAYGIHILNLRNEYTSYKEQPDAENSCSLSFILGAENGNKKCVFTGDCHTDYVFGLNNVGNDTSAKGPCFFVDLPHHGSECSTTNDFFENIQPQIMAVTCPPIWNQKCPDLGVLRNMKSSKLKNRTWDYVDTSSRSENGGVVWFYRKKDSGKRNSAIRRNLVNVPNFNGFFIGFY